MRGAFKKRRKSETLNQAFLEVESNTVDAMAACSGSPDPSCSNVQTIETSASTYNSVKTQCNVPTRTRRIQVKPSVVDAATHCNLCCDSKTQDIIYANEDIDIHLDESSDLQDTDADTDNDYHLSDDSDHDSSEDSSDDDCKETNYRLEKNNDVMQEKCFIVSETALCEMLSVCRTCCVPCISVIDYTKGTMICTSSFCALGHTNRWQSQPSLGKLPSFNLILSSGNNISKVLSLFYHAKIKGMSSRSVRGLQSAYTVPAVTSVFLNQQADLLSSLKERSDIVMGGDARCDSPGYSAKYGSYSLMDLKTSKIIDLQLVQSNEVKGSCHMELEGLKRCFAYLLEQNIQIQDLVTDRRDGISKKLQSAANKRDAEEIQQWIQAIVNHCYWIASSSGTDGQLKLDKWVSISKHVINKHIHDSELFPQCEHGDLDDEDRVWMKEGSRCYKMVNAVITGPYLLRDIPKLSPEHQTYGLEVFHSVVNQFAPKNTHFFYSTMLARSYVAALHFNENGTRKQAVTLGGELKWKMSKITTSTV